MNLYLYDGDVTYFGRPIAHYKAYTHAVTEKKALSNIKSKWKKDNGYLPGFKIDLPGKIQILESKGDN